MSVLNIPTDNQKIDAGKQALMRYQALAAKPGWLGGWFGNDWPYNYDQLESICLQKNPEFISRLGAAVIAAQSQLNVRRLDEAMERVLDKTPLNPIKIPDVSGFIQGITDELSSFDFSLLGDASLDLAKAVAEPVKDAVSGVGESVSFLGNNLKYIVMIIVGVLIFVGYGYVKKRD